MLMVFHYSDGYPRGVRKTYYRYIKYRAEYERIQDLVCICVGNSHAARLTYAEYQQRRHYRMFHVFTSLHAALR